MSGYFAGWVSCVCDAKTQPVAVAQSGKVFRQSFREIWIFNGDNFGLILKPLASESQVWVLQKFISKINPHQGPLNRPEISPHSIKFGFEPALVPIQPHVHYTEVQFAVHLTISYANYER